MHPKTITCPQCGQSDQVEKVSTVYMEGIGSGRLGRLALSGNLSTTDLPGRVTAIPTQELALLSRKLAPPSSGKREVTRLIHPDLVVLVFSAILPVFLAGIASTQGALFIPVLLFILGFYVIYFWRRKALIARFESQKKDRQSAVRRAERAIGRWMNTYYCARDEVVFEAGKPFTMPVDEMNEMLFS